MTPALCGFLALLVVGSAPPAKLDSNVDLRCGSYCLYAALGSLGVDIVNFSDLESRLGQPSQAGYSMQQLAEAANAYGVHSLGVTTTLEDLTSRREPFACIALLDGGHFVCIYDVDAKSVFVVDPPSQRLMARDAFQTMWDGRALLLSKSPLEPIERNSYLARGAAVVALSVAVGAVLMYGFRRSRGTRHA